MEWLQYWWPAPLAVCLVLAGIHGYLGIHVLARKVIFVDLAMAQIAALGATFAYVLGYDAVSNPQDAGMVYAFSLAFTLIGAAVFAFTRMRHEKVPQEAFIGITYAGASAIAILVLAKSPHGGEQLKQMLAGNIILVRWADVLGTVAIYAAIGAFHWFFRRRFFQISLDHEAAIKDGVSVRLWDFLFYVSFGVVITSSVAVAGVLLVFSYLVVPAAVATLFANEIRHRVAIGWVIGVVVSVAGLLLSYHGDLPPGPSVVAIFSVVLAIAAIAHYLHQSVQKGQSLLRLTAGVGAIGLLILASTFLKKQEEHQHHATGFDALVRELKSDDETVQLDALAHLEKSNDHHAIPHVIELLKKTKSDRIIEHAAGVLATMKAVEALPILKEVTTRDVDADLKVSLARAMLDLHDAAGFGILIEVQEKGEAQLAREQARKLIEERSGLKFDTPDAIRRWWADRGASLKWRETTRRFE